MTQEELGSAARRIQDVYAQREVGGRKDRQNPGRKLMIAERNRGFAQALDRHLILPLAETRILDVGCGDASQLAWMQAAGAQPHHLHGVDLLHDKIDRAQARYPDYHLAYLNAETLPFPDRRFDLLISMTVFSSILEPAMARNVAHEMTRVLKPGGLVLWYDLRYPNPWNANVRAMTRRRIQDLFPRFTPALGPSTLLPQLARALGHLDRTSMTYGYACLSRLPPLRSHLLGVLRAPAA